MLLLSVAEPARDHVLNLLLQCKVCNIQHDNNCVDYRLNFLGKLDLRYMFSRMH